MGGGRQQNYKEIKEFNSFIDTMELVDAPLVGWRFTWVQIGGHAMSRLDRTLISLGWLRLWPNATQFVLDWSISDHCPIILRHEKVEWGPKPFRFFNYYIIEPGFHDFMKRVYDSFQVQGWGAFFFFKGKLKLLKKEVGVRSLEKFSEHRFRIQDLVKNIHNLKMDGMSLEVALERELLFIFGFCAYLILCKTYRTL